MEGRRQVREQQQEGEGTEDRREGKRRGREREGEGGREKREVERGGLEASGGAGLPSLPSSPPVLRRHSPPGDAHTDKRATVTWLRWCVHARGSYTRRHLDSPYPPYSSVRTTRLRTVYTAVRQGRGSPLRQRARRGPPRVIPIRLLARRGEARGKTGRSMDGGSSRR